MKPAENHVPVSFLGVPDGEVRLLQDIFSPPHGFRIVGVYASCKEAQAHSAGPHAQLVVMDGTALGMSGVSFIHRLKTLAPSLKGLVLLAQPRDPTIGWWDFIQSGADAVLAKPPDAAEYLDAARAVLAGDHILAPVLLRASSASSESGPREAAGNVSFSPRQAEILALVAADLPDKQIAVRLGISKETVADHFKNLFARFGVHSRGALVAKWLDGRTRT